MKNDRLLGTTLLSLAIPVLALAQQMRPNIVLILADDMGYSDIGCFGSEIKTPNLDRLSSEGMRMTQFYNASRSCPSRASLLTGMYHHKAGVGSMDDANGTLTGYLGHLNDSCLTIAEALRANGYATYMAGKWHLNDQRPNWPVDRGFDSSFVFLKGAGSYFYPGGVLPMEALHASSMVRNDKPYEPPHDGYYHTDAFSENAVRFIGQNDPAKPFFLYLAYTAPHWPLQAYPEDIAKYKGVYDAGFEVMREARYNRMVAMGIIKPEWKMSKRDSSVPPWNSLCEDEKTYWSKVMEIFAAVVDRMDQGIGKVISELERTNQLDNTLIMFVSDNGGCNESKLDLLTKYNGEMGSGTSFLTYDSQWANVSNVPFRYFKHWMHEGGISTPFVARYPKMIKPGTIASQPAHIIDVMATCLELSGTNYTSDTNTKLKPLDGKSLTPAFKGENVAINDTLFFEHLGYRALRLGDYKIVSVYPANVWALYNMATDRSELHDLSKTLPAKVTELDAVYQLIAKRSNVVDWALVPKN